MQILNHVLPGVPFVASPNKGGVINPEYIVMHYTAGWTASAAINWFTNPASKACAQLVLDRDGSLTQMAPFNRAAWHAGPSAYNGVRFLNNHAVGIEIVNPGFLKEGPGGQILAPDNHGGWTPVPPSRLQGYDLSVRAPHSRIGGGTYIWPSYTAAQYAKLDEIVAALMATYHIKDVVSHEEIDTRGWKVDPGASFDIRRYKSMVHGQTVGRQADTPMMGTAQVTAKLNVRQGPGTNHPVIVTLAPGGFVAVIEDVGEWVHINYAPGKTGYVSQQFLRAA